jgi:hypothetical protein
MTTSFTIMANPLNIMTLTLEPVLTADFLTVSHAADQRYLEARWARPVSSGEFREGMEAVYESIFGRRAELLLMDYRLAGTPTVSDQNWLVRRMVTANETTPLRRSARLFSEDLFQRIVGEIIDEKVETYPYRVRAFESEALARQWLLHGSRHYR